MPYCSIEEAWGNNFLNDEKRFNKIVPEGSNPNIKENYNFDTYYEDNEDDNDDNRFCKKKSKIIKKKKNFSRTYNRLPEHSGPITRLPRLDTKILNSKKKKNQDKNEENSIISYDEENSCEEEEQMEEEESNIMEENKENFKNKEHYINFLLNENKKLKDILKKKKNNGNEYDNIFDLVLFLSFGVFIILFLDIISKSIRRLSF